jgi:hypothetical protein
MKIDSRHLVLALVCGLAISACSKSTYLEVQFIGSVPEIHSIDVTLTLTPPGSAAALHSSDMITLPGDAAIILPTSMAFKLDSESGNLLIDATARDAQHVAVATAQHTTTIMHAQTWTVVLDFGGGLDAGAPADDAMTDTGTDGAGGGIVITDGSIEASTGCAAVTLSATETVSLDYNSSGPALDSLNLLWASVDVNRQFIGWMKFGLRAIPNTFKVMSANLNLTFSSAAGFAPALVVEYSAFDGWTRKDAATNNLVVAAPISGNSGAPLPGVNSYPLFVGSNHDWQADIVDGTLTVGIDNKVTVPTGQRSDVQFQGVNHLIPLNDGRPTLDLVLCR